MKRLWSIFVPVSTGMAGGFLAVTYARYLREMRAAKARLAGSKILKTDRGDIEYALEGEGFPVLSLHGAGGGYDQGLWAARLALGEGYRFISVSRYGYLRSPIPLHASIKTQAALYKELLDRLPIRKVVVLGASAGGPSATQFANDYPERTLALLLISAVSKSSAPGDQSPFYVGLIHLLQQSDYAYWLLTKFMRAKILSLMGISEDVCRSFTPPQTQMAQEMLDLMHPMTARYRGTVNDGTMLQREAVPTNSVSAPTLILHAKDDNLVSYRHSEHAHASIKGSRLVVFDRGGHGLLSQMPAVRQEVKEFLRSL